MKSLSSFLKSAPFLIGSSILATGIIAFAAPAKAAVFGCPSGIADNVTNTSACQYSNTASQDFLNQGGSMTVNSEGFFGFSEGFFGFDDWQFFGKNEIGGQSGAWSVPNDLGSQVMLVFKSGRNTTLLGYLADATSGSWDSPFENSLFDVPNTRDVSHVSYYYRNGDTPTPEAVPEPMTILGTMAAIGVGGVLKRRCDAAQS